MLTQHPDPPPKPETITQEVTVTVDGTERHFTLTRYNLKRAVEHIRIQETAWNKAQEQCEAALGDPMEMTLSSEAYLKAISKQVLFLLQEPADFGEPLTEEEYWLLDPADPVNVMSVQESLSDVGTIVMGGQYIMDQARERVMEEIDKALAEVPDAREDDHNE